MITDCKIIGADMKPLSAMLRGRFLIFRILAMQCWRAAPAEVRPSILSVFAAIAFFLAVSNKAFSNELSELRLGSIAMDVPATMHQRLLPVTRYLGDYLGIPVTLRLSPNMESAIDSLVNGETDITYLSPVAYLNAHKRGGARLVAKILTRNEGSFKLVVVVREDSAIRNIADLAGKRFAFGDRSALLQRAVVVGAGLPLEKLGSYAFVGHYDNIARGVAAGDFDAGIVKDTTILKGNPLGLRIIYKSPMLPPYNIAVSKNVSPAMYEKLKKIFLGLNIKNPIHRVVIQAMDPAYTGFAATSDKEYQIVRRLIAPFESQSKN